VSPFLGCRSVAKLEPEENCFLLLSNAHCGILKRWLWIFIGLQWFAWAATGKGNQSKTSFTFLSGSPLFWWFLTLTLPNNGFSRLEPTHTAVDGPSGVSFLAGAARARRILGVCCCYLLWPGGIKKNNLQRLQRDRRATAGGNGSKNLSVVSVRRPARDLNTAIVDYTQQIRIPAT
jgi:hypothetical protein